MVSMLVNVAIAVVSVLAWLSLVTGRGDDRSLAQHGLASLKYYTVLSNLFSAGASLVYAVDLLLFGGASPLVLALKLAATTTVMVTFVTTAVLLRPAIGWKPLYRGGNFWFHLVLPLVATADLCLCVPAGMLPLASTLLPVALTLAYGIGYLRPIRIYGAERDGKTYDFYGFLRWGADRIWVVMAGMMAMAWMLALLLWVASRACVGA